MGEHHNHKDNTSDQPQPWASPAMYGILLIGAVFAALFCYLAYYSLITTPDNPLQMMQ